MSSLGALAPLLPDRETGSAYSYIFRAHRVWGDDATRQAPRETTSTLPSTGLACWPHTIRHRVANHRAAPAVCPVSARPRLGLGAYRALGVPARTYAECLVEPAPMVLPGDG